MQGGFGGGALADDIGSCSSWAGAGGGYSGASGMNTVSYNDAGYGGGSFNNGTSQINIPAANTGHGSVRITYEAGRHIFCHVSVFVNNICVVYSFSFPLSLTCSSI